ncbi:SH2 domain-containing protein 7 isoform X2 [Macrotis lagotis]|uniref:SH2 domain-containing protein 7 isoform X2 n=1 Tax=Macrotis lagotis TaxID=92651 RepID=UPI003D68F2E1
MDQCLKQWQTEELLRDRPIGCFLIRLSDKAMGYVLSYRGYNRCRHFVISQLQNRRYAISGDTCNHPTLTALISYYQGAKIEPFGETLTTACPRPEESSLYDAISLNLLLVNPPESTSPSKEEQELGDLEYLRSSKDKDPKVSPTPKPKISFVHSKKSLEECSWKPSEEDNDLSGEAPPLPKRNSSLLMESFSSRHSGNIIYAELKKMNHNPQSLSMEASEIPHQTPSPGREPQRRLRNPSGEELTLQTRDAPSLASLNATKSLGKKLDPNKKSPTVPHHPKLEHSSPVPISTSPGDRSSRASSPHHQAWCSPESTGSNQGLVIHAVPQLLRSSGSNKSGGPNPPSTHDLMPKGSSFFSLEDQTKVSENHDYEPIPGRLPISAFLPLKTTSNQLEGSRDWMVNAYEKIPGSQAVPMPSLPCNPYEQIPILNVQETKQSHSHKVEKYRRFFFTDRKNKQ